MTNREQEILAQLDMATAVEYYGRDYLIVGKAIDVEEMRIDPEDEPMPYICVIEGYGDPNNGMWQERTIFVEDLADDPNLKLFTLEELTIGDNDVK